MTRSNASQKISSLKSTASFAFSFGLMIDGQQEHDKTDKPCCMLWGLVWKFECALFRNMQWSVLQRPAKKCVNLTKQDPGRARQKSQARAGRNFSQPRTNTLADLFIWTFFSHSTMTFSLRVTWIRQDFALSYLPSK